MSSVLRIAGTEVKPGSREFIKLRVARRLIGTDFYIPVHLVAGARPGPTVGVMIAVHGDEVFPIPGLGEVLRQLDPNEMAGDFVLVPVSNPIAFAAGARQTPDFWDKTNLWHNFPGKDGGTITQQMGHVITTEILSALDVLLEFHSGGVGRVQKRVEYDGRVSAELKKRIFEMAVSFGTGLVHESPVPQDGPTGYLNGKGKPAFQIEVGGPFLSGPEDDALHKIVVCGVMNVLKFLKVIPGEPVLPERQFWFPREGVRFEANPREGGYLLSRKRVAADLGTIVEKDEVLGEILDPYSYKILEVLKSPVKGVLVFHHLNGPMEAGNKGYAIAKLDGGKWIKGYSFEN